MENKKTNFFDLEHFIQRAISTLNFTKQSILQKQKQKVGPTTKPGFLMNSLHQHPPEQGINLEQIHQQIKQKILPGFLYWQSSKFFGYFASTISETSLYADMFSEAFNTPAFNYAISPAHTELSNKVVDWCFQALGLPKIFQRENQGGGSISSSASHSAFLAVHTAKLQKLALQNIEPTDPRSLKLVGYVSETAHLCTLRAMMLKDVHFRRSVPCYYDKSIKNYTVDLSKLEEMIQQDLKDGLIPFFYGSSIGTTLTAASDPIPQISKICKKYRMWHNVDAAYLGSTWICEEYRGSQKGIEDVDSLIVNFSKLGFIGVGGSVFFVANKKQFQKSMSLNNHFGLYQSADLQSNKIIQYKDWSVDLAKPPICFRFYFLFRFYGLEKIRQSYRDRQSVAKHLQKLIDESSIFEIFCKRQYTVICFRLKGVRSAKVLEQLSRLISDLQQGYISCGCFKDQFILRVAIGNANTTVQEISAWWSKIQEVSLEFLQNKKDD